MPKVDPSISTWAKRQRENRALGKLPVNKARRLEEIPDWTWELCTCANVIISKGTWTAYCGWSIERGRIAYKMFPLGKLWQSAALFGRDQQEHEQLTNVIWTEWLKVKDFGWTVESDAAVTRLIKETIRSWKRYSVGELAKEFKRDTTVRINQDLSHMQVIDGQHNGKATLLDRVKSLQTHLTNIDTVINSLGPRTAIADVTPEVVEATTNGFEDIAFGATLREFMKFAQYWNAWKLNNGKQQRTIDGDRADSWAARRTHAQR